MQTGRGTGLTHVKGLRLGLLLKPNQYPLLLLNPSRLLPRWYRPAASVCGSRLIRETRSYSMSLYVYGVRIDLSMYATVPTLAPSSLTHTGGRRDGLGRRRARAV